MSAKLYNGRPKKGNVATPKFTIYINFILHKLPLRPQAILYTQKPLFRHRALQDPPGS